MTALSTYIPFSTSILSLEYSTYDGASSYIGLDVQQRKGELDVNQIFTAQTTKELTNFIPSQKSIHLVITDDQVLSKEVQHTGTDNEIVSEAFPNLNLTDFYFQILRTEDKSFIAVCRKAHIEDMIDTLKKDNIMTTSVSLGGLKSIALVPYVAGERLLSYTEEIHFGTNTIHTILPKKENINEEYAIEGLTFPATHTLPLAVALDTFSVSDAISGNISSLNEELTRKHKESRFFKNALQIGIGTILITLLINFFVFNSNYKKWQGLQEELQVYTTQKEQITKKQSEVATKEALVQSILTTGFSKSSLYIDQIINILPTSIRLTSLDYQPLLKPVRKNKFIELQKNYISITGKSIDKESFTIWLRTIENLSFIDVVTITKYGLDKQNTSDFELTLTIKSDGTKN
ncbi:hypothetical protein ABW636_20295 [Aquimarina sp. 2201CG1-2-11]|uniref:PilN domain-containing protein n=1 Tax=Aquimarina discodermiae TaxID=3231043 RepID=UPI003462CF01